MLGSLAEIMRFFGGFSVHFGDRDCRRAFGGLGEAFLGLWGGIFGACGRLWGCFWEGLGGRFLRACGSELSRRRRTRRVTEGNRAPLKKTRVAVVSRECVALANGGSRE